MRYTMLKGLQLILFFHSSLITNQSQLLQDLVFCLFISIVIGAVLTYCNSIVIVNNSVVMNDVKIRVFWYHYIRYVILDIASYYD
jgi:uncharacterized membrane protein SirB2